MENSNESKKYREWLEKELLDISFHDSYLADIKKENNVLILVIKVDTYWFPGKPFALLKLINPINGEKLINEYKKLTLDSEPIISEISIKRREFGNDPDSKKVLLVVSIDFIYTEPSTIEVFCSNFWVDRVETYGNKD